MKNVGETEKIVLPIQAANLPANERSIPASLGTQTDKSFARLVGHNWQFLLDDAKRWFEHWIPNWINFLGRKIRNVTVFGLTFLDHTFTLRLH